MTRRVVEAIHDGKLVRAYEEDALREGLFIIRTVEENPTGYYGATTGVSRKAKQEEDKKLLFDDFRKPLKWSKDQIVKELVDNFHWVILDRRKAFGLTRKQLGQAVRASENDIKLLENGILPSQDFILINKLEQHFGISLRKNPVIIQSSAKLAGLDVPKERNRRDFREVVEKVRQEKASAVAKPAEQMVEEIEIIDDE